MREGIATQTNRYNLFNSEDGTKLLGVVTVQLPAFEIATNEFSGAGVGGSLNVPAPGVMNAMAMTISIPVIYGEAIKFFELGGTKSLDLRRDLIVTNAETKGLEHVPDRWSIMGPVTKSDPGKAEQKATGDATIEVQVWYAIHWMDGEEILEWDPFVPIHKVNGVDLLAEMKKNIGL